ncbi:MAG TPA: HAD family hydrolase [Actinomycetota bacterium]|nr:HAD family hydrolase [Actinomycetota bacterium]
MRAAVFLDRDGTLIEERGHLGDPNDVVVLPGVPDALRTLAGGGFALVVATNQAGVARGLFTEADVDAVNRRIAEVLGEQGIRLDGWYFCPHHPDLTGPCQCRKPGPGMLLAATQDLNLDLQRSWMVGDHPTDVQAGQAAGARPIMVRTGHGMLPGAKHDPGPGVPVVDDLVAAAEIILRDASRLTGGRPVSGSRGG